MYILSQVLVVISGFFYASSMLSKSRRNLIIFLLISDLIFCSHHFGLGAITGLLIMLPQANVIRQCEPITLSVSQKKHPFGRFSLFGSYSVTHLCEPNKKRPFGLPFGSPGRCCSPMRAHNAPVSTKIKNQLQIRVGFTLAPQVDVARQCEPITHPCRKKNTLSGVFLLLAPQVGFEPTAYRLTVECSTTELLGNIKFLLHKQQWYYITR